MIDYGDYNLFWMMFAWTGSTVAADWPQLVICMVVAAITAVVKAISGVGMMEKWIFTGEQGVWWDSQTTHGKFTMFPLCFLLVFRTGISYRRFFEGRGHIGGMVKASRELARGISTYVVGDDEKTQMRRANCARLIKAYTIAVRLSLRKEEGAKYMELESVCTKAEYEKLKEVKKNFCVVILMWLGEAIAEFKDQLLFPRSMDFMQKEVATLMEVWMGMQKLATTPFPFPYIQMLTTILYLFMFTVGIPIAAEYGFVGIPLTFLMAYALFGLNAIGAELEDPFGEEDNDLPVEFFEGAACKACAIMLPPALDPKQLEPIASTPVGVAMNAGPTPSPPTGTPAKEPVFEEATVRAELSVATTKDELSPALQTLFRQYFDRYDLNGNGKIDNNKELTQLVTNLAFTLKIGADLSKLLQKVEGVGEGFCWEYADFVSWYLVQAKA